MSKNEKGLGVVGILLVILAVGAVVSIGWLILSKQSDAKTDATAANNEQTQRSSNQNSSIHTVHLSLQTEADTSKLPSYTPSSFKDYFAAKLRDNKYYNDGSGDLIYVYEISTISDVNIKGGAGPVDKDGNAHPGGAPRIWVLTPTGMWDEESLNGLMCESRNGGLIYEEFADHCNPGNGNFIKNPNGSIESLK